METSNSGTSCTERAKRETGMVRARRKIKNTAYARHKKYLVFLHESQERCPDCSLELLLLITLFSELPSLKKHPSTKNRHSRGHGRDICKWMAIASGVECSLQKASRVFAITTMDRPSLCCLIFDKKHYITLLSSELRAQTWHPESNTAFLKRSNIIAILAT